ncbi:ATP-binding protein [Microbacterium algeriense]|uniref:ATP-binding protein n=1 Tax=Microbacterium algeriense TaxID=2615184 RepID=UPI001CECA15F|nr:ATP-binding protein [Microbacterium algeriense]
MIDEAAEFSRVALDALRQPLESGAIEVHRAGFTARFPARFQLLLAMNPCPCGNYGVRGAECICPPMAIRRYATRLSGPLRDRIDIDLQVTRVAASRATGRSAGVTTTAAARARVAAARKRAAARWQSTPWRRNADVPGTWLRQGALRLPAGARAPLDRALERGALTLRGYDRVLRVAWTMADLADREQPGVDEIGRALHLRSGVPR